MTVTVTDVSLLLDSANDAVEEARRQYRENVVSQHRLLRTMTGKEISKLVESGSWVSASEGDPIWVQGAPVSDVVFLIEGNSGEEIREADRGQCHAVVNLLGPGDEIGLLSLLDRSPHHASAITMKRTQGLRKLAALMEEMLKVHPEWYESIAQVAAARLRTRSLWLRALI